jgi:nucleotide-binding universal stress UspA family protein
MIVIGSHGPDPELEIFLGSVANHVIHKSKIPVTIVK